MNIIKFSCLPYFKRYFVERNSFSGHNFFYNSASSSFPVN